MKTLTKWVVYGVGFGLLTGTCLAADSSYSKEPEGKMQSSRSAGFFDAKSLLGTEIMNNQKQELGDLKDVVFNPQNGETFAAIGVGHDQCALVPWQALKISKSTSGKEEITLNSSKQALASGPTVKADDWRELNNRSFDQSIYQHYGLNRPTTFGGVDSNAWRTHYPT